KPAKTTHDSLCPPTRRIIGDSIWRVMSPTGWGRPGSETPNRFRRALTPGKTTSSASAAPRIAPKRVMDANFRESFWDESARFIRTGHMGSRRARRLLHGLSLFDSDGGHSPSIRVRLCLVADNIDTGTQG